MLDALRLLTETALASPWLLAVIVGLAVVDALLPVVPSEAMIMAAGVAAASGEQDLVVVVAAAAAGAFVGELIGYLIGRGVGPELRSRFARSGARAAAFDKVASLLAARGGTVLLTARFLPAGRTAAVLTAGATGYPFRPFVGLTAVGATLSAAYQAMLGFVGGIAVSRDPLVALAVSFCIAVVVGLLVEAVRRGRARWRAAAQPAAQPAVPPAASRVPEGIPARERRFVGA